MGVKNAKDKMPSSAKAKKILKARQQRNKEKGYPVGPSDVDVEYGDAPGQNEFENNNKKTKGYVSPESPNKININPNNKDKHTDEVLENLIAHELIHTAQFQQAKEGKDNIYAHEKFKSVEEKDALSNLNLNKIKSYNNKYTNTDHEYRRRLNSIMYPADVRKAPMRSEGGFLQKPSAKEEDEIPKAFDIKRLIKYAKEAKIPFSDIIDAKTVSYLVEHDEDYRDAHNKARQIQNTDNRSFFQKIKGDKREYPPAEKTYKAWSEAVEKKKKEQKQREENERKKPKR